MILGTFNSSRLVNMQGKLSLSFLSLLGLQLSTLQHIRLVAAQDSIHFTANMIVTLYLSYSNGKYYSSST